MTENLIAEYQTDFINNTKANVTVTWGHDDGIDFGFIDDEIVAIDFYDRIHDGDLMVAVVKVTIEFMGITQDSFAGGIIVEDVNELKKSIDDEGLVEDAIHEFKVKVENIYQALQNQKVTPA